MVDFVRPDYRVRLFLSVDLTGSTDFKSRSNQSNLEWLKAFQKFYGEFPSLFSRHYVDGCDDVPDISADEKTETPKVWKTIGDEILFVNRVNSIAQLGVYVTAFSSALKEFGAQVQELYGLNTKGNAWIAAFPSPNSSIRLSQNGTTDPFYGDHDVLTEEFELGVDRHPNNYDFLGKGIDGGFRISQNSTIDTFTISPALAYLLCAAKKNVDMTGFDCDFHFHEPQVLKGVIGGKPYPIISIDTNRDAEQKEIHDLQAVLLQQPQKVEDSEILKDYLEKYISYHCIEKPSLKLLASSSEVPAPSHYVSYLEQWELEAESVRNAIATEVEAASEQTVHPPASDATANLLTAIQGIEQMASAIANAGKLNSTDDNED